MNDPTEEIRRQELEDINANSGGREELEQRHGIVWNTSELREAFHVLGFLAPYCVVERKSDGVKGSLQFQDSPRFYFGFQPDE